MISRSTRGEKTMDDLHRAMRRAFWLLAQPINIADLEQHGVLEKAGNRYHIKRPNDVPEGARLRAHYDIVNGLILAKFDMRTAWYQAQAKRAGVDWADREPID